MFNCVTLGTAVSENSALFSVQRNRFGFNSHASSQINKEHENKFYPWYVGYGDAPAISTYSWRKKQVVHEELGDVSLAACLQWKKTIR